MSINKSDCMDYKKLEIGMIKNRNTIVGKVYVCLATGQIMGKGNYTHALEEECPNFEYED